MVKNSNFQYLCIEAKNEKSETTFFLQLLRFEKIKYPYFFHFWPPGRDIDNFCFWSVNMFGWNNVLRKIISVPQSLYCLFKSKQPTCLKHNAFFRIDKILKENHKKHQLHASCVWNFHDSSRTKTWNNSSLHNSFHLVFLWINFIWGQISSYASLQTY